MNKGDFIGFTLGGKHSSDLGIVRVSDGNRYNESLSPTFTDKVIQIPGGDGTYYFGSNFTQKPLAINYAFDSLTESQIRTLKQILNKKEPQQLIYDEAPYKYYLVKTASSPNIKEICFNENNERVYKGEGDLQFVAYFPFARSVHKFLDDYDSSNISEWAAASGLQKKTSGIDVFSQVNNVFSAKLYNAGDIPCGFSLSIPFGVEDGIGTGDIILTITSTDSIQKLKLKKILQKGEEPNKDYCIKINTDSELIEGYILNENQKLIRSGRNYNDSKIAGTFPKIPLGESEITISNLDALPSIDYNYLYY